MSAQCPEDRRHLLARCRHADAVGQRTEAFELNGDDAVMELRGNGVPLDVVEHGADLADHTLPQQALNRLSAEAAHPDEIRGLHGCTDADDADVKLLPELQDLLEVHILADRCCNLRRTRNRRCVDVVTASAERIREFIAESVHMEIAVDALRTAVERNKVRVDGMQTLCCRIACQLADARPPRETDGLPIGGDPPQETQPRLCHAALDLREVDAAGDDVCLSKSEATLKCAFQFLVAVRLDGDADNARRKCSFEILAHRCAVDTEACGDLALLQTICIVEVCRLD